MTEEEILEAKKFLKELEIEGYRWTALGQEKYIIENVIRRIENFNIEVTLKDTEINKLNNAIQNTREEFLKYDWENSTKEQICNQLKSLYESIFMKEDK